jgi:hypothetical protein
VTRGLFFLQLHLQPLVADLQAIHSKNGVLSTGMMVEADETEPTRPPCAVVYHDLCRYNISKRSERIVKVKV